MLLYTLFLRDKNLQLGALSVDLDVSLLVFFSQTGNILVAGAHLLSILVEEHRILNQTLLKLVILFAKLSFARLKLELLLRKVLLFGKVGLLVLVHLATLIKEACSR